MKTGDLIRKARKEYGLTQKELAEKIGTSRQNIAQWESNNRNPKYETLLKISEALETPVFNLLVRADGTGASSKTLADMINWSLSDYVSDQLQQRLLDHFHQLNPQGQEKAVEQVELVSKVPEYRADQDHEDKEKRPHT